MCNACSPSEELALWVPPMLYGEDIEHSVDALCIVCLVSLVSGRFGGGFVSKQCTNKGKHHTWDRECPIPLYFSAFWPHLNCILEVLMGSTWLLMYQSISNPLQKRLHICVLHWPCQNVRHGSTIPHSYSTHFPLKMRLLFSGFHWKHGKFEPFSRGRKVPEKFLSFPFGIYITIQDYNRTSSCSNFQNKNTRTCSPNCPEHI